MNNFTDQKNLKLKNNLFTNILYIFLIIIYIKDMSTEIEPLKQRERDILQGKTLFSWAFCNANGPLTLPLLNSTFGNKVQTKKESFMVVH